MKNVGVLFIHGMGDTEKDYSDALSKNLLKYLSVKDKHFVQTASVYYAPVLQGQQNKLDQRFRKHIPALGSKWFRRLLLSSLGDAGSLLNAHNHEAYNEIHIKVHNALEELQSRVGAGGRIVIIAHSLGVEVISNYLWDFNRYQGIFDRRKELTINYKSAPGKQVTHLVSMGANLPLFVSGLSNVKCFEPPSRAFKWTNYYSPCDVLGYPLKPLGNDYSDVNDVSMKVGGFITKHTWLSHTAYWEDKRFARKLGELLIHESLR